MSKITTIKNYDLFVKECRFFFCLDIYGKSWSGKEWYIVSSNTPEEVLIEKYPEIMKALSPYIFCNESCGIVLQDSKHNDDKFRKRAFFEDPLFFDCYGENLNLQLVSDCNVESVAISKIMVAEAFQVCTPTQIDRIRKYYIDGMTLEQIADGKDPKTIKESIDSGLKKMKKFLE